MRTLIVSHYFPPETGAPQARLSALAAAWAAGGDDVTVLTGMPNHPTGVLPPEYRRAIRRRERRDGYVVLRTWLYATPNEGFARKTASHLSFMLSSVLLGWRASGPADTVVVSSPTFFSIASAWLLARIKRARLVVEVRDLWPAIFVELGVLTNRRVIGLLERLELAAYAAADEVVVVSDGFRANLIGRGVPAAKVHTIRNGVTADRFDPATPPDPYLRAGLGARPDECLVLYAGTHGISQGLPEAAEAAVPGRGRPVHLAFVGEGADKPRLRQQVTELGLGNVTLANAIPPNWCPPCWPPRTSCWSRSAMCRCSRRSSRRRCSSTWPPGGRSSARWPARRRRSCGRPARSSCRPATSPRWPRRSARWPPTRGGAGPWPRRAAPTWSASSTAADLARQYRKILDDPPPPVPDGGPPVRLVVTGGSGFLGGFVLREAAGAVTRWRRWPAARRRRGGARARRAARRAATSPPAARRPPGAGAGLRCGDVLVNLASLGFGHAPAIVAAAERAQVRGAVFVSTTAVTTTLPAATKRVRLAAEQRIAESALDWTILRPTMIYGAPGDRNLSRLLPLLRRAPVLPVPGGGHLQQPVHVADVAHAVLAAAERPGTAGHDLRPGRAGAADLRRAAAHGGAGGGQPDPVRPGAAAAGAGRGPRLRAGQPAAPGSGPSRSAGWPRTRRSRSTPQPATSASRRARSPTGSGRGPCALGLAA